MRRGVALGVVAGVAVVGGAYHRWMVPKIGHATVAEIDAALPAELKVQDAPDPQAEARFERLLDLAARLDRTPLKAKDAAAQVSTADDERILVQVEALLAAGPLRIPPRDSASSFARLTAAKDLAKTFALAAQSARQHGDRAACARWAALGLRYGDAYQAAGGVVIDGLVGIAIRSIGLRAAYLAEIDGGLDGAGETKVLALLRPEDGRSPEMAAQLRRDFQGYLRPALLDPKVNVETIMAWDEPPALDEEGARPEPDVWGTFDPIETARLAGGIYRATMADLRRTRREATHEDARLVEAATRDLPPVQTSDEVGPPDGWRRLRFRWAMNAGRNTLGRRAATNGTMLSLGDVAAREAANRNLVRSVFLLRMGRSPDAVDPYSGRSLLVDRKRKIVWSVGPDGGDSGGAIGRGGEPSTPDLGYPYGDRSFAWTVPPRLRMAPQVAGGPPQ